MKKRSSRLAEKLRNAVHNLNADVFGYESRVTKNIIGYVEKLSTETGLPPDRLVVRIFKDSTAIHVAVYNQGIPVKKITIKELIILFTNSEPSVLFNLETKVVQGIETFMNTFCETHHIGVEELQICIVTSHEKVWVKGYQGITYIKDIPLSVLIKYFMQ